MADDDDDFDDDDLDDEDLDGEDDEDAGDEDDEDEDTDDGEVEEGGDFCPVATLSEGVSYFTDRFNFEHLVIDEGEKLYVGMAAMINEEIVVVKVVGAGFVDVARGCSDTIPHVHPEGSDIWFYPDNVGVNVVEYSAGEKVSVQPLPFLTSGEVLDSDESDPQIVKMNYRFSRPYPPGLMRSNGTPWFQGVVLSSGRPNMVLTWTHRDRVLQEDQQIDHFQGNIGPEPGTTYVARIYDQWDELKRTEVGITGTTWTYTWSKAMSDLGLTQQPAGSQGVKNTPAYMMFTSHRQGLDGWQAYRLPFTVNNESPAIYTGQLSQMVLQPPPDSSSGGGSSPPAIGMFVGQMAQMALQPPPDPASGGGGSGGVSAGVFVAALAENTAQSVSLYTPMNRALFEAPYTFLLRRNGSVPVSGRGVTVAARPSDRLTDTHKIWSREQAEPNAAQGSYGLRASPPFTPWATIDKGLDYLENTVAIRTSSLYDGVPLNGVKPGQLAMIGAEMVRVVAISENEITLARGCADTIPTRHGPGARIWFFEAGHGFDNTSFRTPPVKRSPAKGDCFPDPGYVHLQYKMVPDVFGPALSVNEVPTDTLDMKYRNQRPFPPGQVMVNGGHWFMGAMIEPERNTVITWVQRNRITQGKNIVDHVAPNIPHESGTTYRLRIRLLLSPKDKKGCPLDVIVREEYVSGNRYDYGYDKAYADGHRIARLLSRYYGRDVCGMVGVPITLDAVRGGQENWQGYSIMLGLPAAKCKPGSIGGPGGIGHAPGNGNGNTGGWDDWGSGSPDGNGPRGPDPMPPWWTWPVIPPWVPPWLDPSDPTDPPSPPPEGIGYWDYRWDTFWAADGFDYDPGDGSDQVPNDPDDPDDGSGSDSGSGEEPGED